MNLHIISARGGQVPLTLLLAPFMRTAHAAARVPTLNNTLTCQMESGRGRGLGMWAVGSPAANFPF